MRSPDWPSTAIFLAWDDWGGFYDHVVPPPRRRNGYGLRVPGARDHPVRAARASSTTRPLSFDAYVKFIEDDFLGGARLDPRTDGRPDPRPSVRESMARVGDLAHDFDFRQRPRPPLLLPEHPPLLVAWAAMAAPVTRDQELELTIDSLAYGGNGVARLNGFVVFVRRGLPGRHASAPA